MATPAAVANDDRSIMFSVRLTHAEHERARTRKLLLGESFVDQVVRGLDLLEKESPTPKVGPRPGSRARAR